MLRIIDGPQAAQARRAGSASGADGRRELLRVNVRARAGAPSELAERHGAELQQALTAVTGKPAHVVVSPPRPLDVYA